MAQPPKAAAIHLKTQLKRRDPQEIHQNTVGIGATFLWQELQTQPKPKTAGIDGAMAQPPA